jgi:hypothetical protein
MRFDDTDFGGMNFIVQQQNFEGVLRVTNFRDLNGFVLKLELFKFLKSNQFLLENVIKQNEINPTDSKLIDRVASEIVNTVKINYQQIKSITDYLKQVINWARNEGHQIVSISFYDKIHIALEVNQIVQLYHVIESFGKNYFILESIFNIITKTKQTDDLKELKDDKVTNHIPINVKSSKPVNTTNYVEQQKQSVPKNDFEILLEYCYNSNLRNLVIHYTVNYYQYISKSSVSVEENDHIIKLTIPNVLPYSLSMDSEFFYTYILSNNSCPLSSIITYASKLIQKVLCEGEEKYWKNPMFMMVFSLITYIYSIRYLIELHPNVFDMQFESLVSNNDDLQKRVLQYYTNAFMKTLKLEKHENGEDYVVEYIVNDFNIETQWSEQTEELIKKYSEEESHIIPVSQEMFVDKVLKKVKTNDTNKCNSGFAFSNKKIIDLDTLIKSTDPKHLKETNLIDPKNKVDFLPNDDTYLTKYLSYFAFENGAITKIYSMLMEYSKDPTSIALIKNIPTELLNLFPVIANDILNNHNLPESMDSTYDYYQVVINKLPHPETVRYTTILFIIYQIIIPYYYSFYKKTIFIDHLI